ALLIEFDVGLRDDVLVLFPRRKIERERLQLCGTLAAVLELGIHLLGFRLLDMIASFVFAVARIDDGDVVNHPGVLYPAVWRLNESVVVDARIATQRRDQSNVRTFRRFNRADSPIVRRVNVADFESRALTRQTARPQR